MCDYLPGAIARQFLIYCQCCAQAPWIMPRVKTMPKNTGRGSSWSRNRWRFLGWGVAVIMLLLPLISMQFTDEVDWDITDFIIFGAMLSAVGGVFELVARMTPNKAYRAAVGVALAASFILIWVNAAVGIIGNEENSANLMYYGVLAVGIVGTVIARRRPIGMARAMIAVAIAQVMVAVIASTPGLGFAFVITGFFVALWLISAWLFKKADRKDPGL